MITRYRLAQRVIPGTDRQRFRVWGLIVLLVFAISRVLYGMAGVHFDSLPLYSSWAFLDPDLLQHDLLRSIYYLHAQPPLFNLSLGIVLKLAPNHFTAAFQILFVGMGIALAVSMYALFVRLGFRPVWSAVVTSAFMVNPATVLYENFLFYTYPVAIILCMSGLFLNRYVEEGKMRDASVFFALVGTLVLLRSLFHPLFFFLMVVLVLLVRRKQGRTTLLASLLPAACIILWYLKNALVFGILTSSSWFGMNIAKITTFSLPLQEREALVARHELSPYALIPPFSALDRYEKLDTFAPDTRAPSLEAAMKTAAHVNYHNASYIRISKYYQQDALFFVTHYPLHYAKNVLLAYFLYCRPAGEYLLLEPNRTAIAGLEEWVSRITTGEPIREPITLERGVPQEDLWHQMLRSGWFLLFGIPLLIVLASHVVLKRTDLPPPSRAVVAFAVCVMTFTMLFATTLEIGENNRFCFEIDPLLCVIGAVLIKEYWKRSRRRDSRAPTR